jgi:hypothetical protein
LSRIGQRVHLSALARRSRNRPFLVSRHLYQRSKKVYYASRKALADYYQQSLEELQQERGTEVEDSGEWLDLVLALAYQLLFLPDEASHLQAIEQLLNAFYSYGEQTGEIVRVLRDISQEQSTNLTSPIARQTATQLLRYIETAWGSREMLTAANTLLEHVAHVPSFPTELLIQLYNAHGQAHLSHNELQLALELPPILLAPFCWFEQERPDFYQKYVVPLLAKYKEVDNSYQS